MAQNKCETITKICSHDFYIVILKIKKLVFPQTDI